MTATSAALRPSVRDALPDLGVRALLVLAAGVAVVAGAPAWARTPLSALAALGVVLAVVARTRRAGTVPRALHGALVAAGGGVVALALLGVALDLLHLGLTTATWGAAVGVLELAVLAGAALVPVRSRIRRPLPLAALGWGAAVVAVLAAAVVWSVVSFGATHVAPLAVAATRSGDRVAVTVTSGAATGSLELDLVTDRGRTVLARGLHVGPGATAHRSITLPAGSRGLVQVLRPGATTPVRQLVLDEGTTR